MRNKAGFNLVGLIVSIGVFLILSASLWVAIDPSARINRAKDTRREQDVLILAQALKDYVRHHQGALPIIGDITSSKKVLCATATSLTCAGTSKTCLTIDSSTDFLDSYLATLPVDPAKISSVDSGYYLQADGDNSVIIGSCDYDVAAVTFNTRIKVAAIPCLGTELFGYCWYQASAVNMSCDQVCAANALSCVSGVSYSDPTCTLNIALGTFGGGTCSVGCTDFNGSISPSNISVQDFCLTNSVNPAYTCGTISGGDFYKLLCACE